MLFKCKVNKSTSANWISWFHNVHMAVLVYMYLESLMSINALYLQTMTLNLSHNNFHRALAI